MENLEILNQIKAKEEEAQKIIDEAKLKAAAMIKEVKFTKRKQILQAAEEEANSKARRLTEQFRKQTQEEMLQIDQEMNQQIEKIEKISSQNKEKARDYIVDEVLGLWQLQG